MIKYVFALKVDIVEQVLAVSLEFGLLEFVSYFFQSNVKEAGVLILMCWHTVPISVRQIRTCCLCNRRRMNFLRQKCIL